MMPSKHRGTHTANTSTFRAQQHLQTQTTVGDNVMANRTSKRIISNDTSRRPTKKPKIAADYNPNDVMDISDDDMDELTANRTATELPQARLQSGNKPSPDTSLNLDTEGVIAIGDTDPFYFIEDRMSSGKRSKSARKRVNEQQMNQLDIRRPLEERDTTVAASRVPRYMGTARSLSQRASITSTASRQRSGKLSSPYFHQTTNGFEQLEDPPDPDVSMQIVSQHASDGMETTLRGSFIQNNGMRRSSDFGTSADELACQPMYSRLSPSKLSHKLNGSKQRSQSPRKASVFQADDGLEESNIRPAQFKQTGRQTAGLVSPIRRNSKAVQSGYRLTSISIGDICINEADGGLILLPSSTNFVVIRDGRNLCATQDFPLVRVDKLQRLICAAESSKLRLETSKSGSTDYRIDIVLISHFEASRLCRALEDKHPHSCKVDRQSRYVVPPNTLRVTADLY